MVQNNTTRKSEKNNQYIFQVDWFSEQIPWWEKHLHKYKGKTDIQFLEVGTFEGRAAIWLLKNILTAPSARLTCIDTFSGSPEHENYHDVQISKIEKNFNHNIQMSGAKEKVIVKKGYSRDILPTLKQKSYDVIYIDGSHKTSDVLEDAVLSKLLIKRGGIIIFDDYIWEEGDGKLDKPKLAIDAFLEIYEGQYILLYSGKQILIEMK